MEKRGKRKVKMKDVIDKFKEELPSSKKKIILESDEIYTKYTYEYTYQYTQHEKNKKFLTQLYGKKHQKDDPLEFLVDEFKGSITPKALIQAIKTKSKIDVPITNTPIESLNNLLRREDLYKFMKERPNEVKDSINQLEHGQKLKPLEIIRLNRLSLEESYPYETPKSQIEQAFNEEWIKIKYPKEDVPKYTLQFLKHSRLLDQYVTQDKKPEYKCVNIRMISEELKEFIFKAKEVYQKEVEIYGASQKEKKETEICPGTSFDNEGEKKGSKIIYQVTRNKKGHFLLNLKLIKKLRGGKKASVNYYVFQFLMENSGANMTRPELDKFLRDKIETGEGLNGQDDLYQIVARVGFEGEFLKAFINISKTTICLNKNITKEDWKNLEFPTKHELKYKGKSIPHLKK